MTTQKIYRHERGPEYDSPNDWKKFMDESIETLANVMMASATGSAEKALHGAATMGYDPATLIRLAAAVSMIRESLKSSTVNWLGRAQQMQAGFCAARADERFQAFLMGMNDDNFRKNGGAQ